jgi:diguanylate cyclase (GGDEF)-like protein
MLAHSKPIFLVASDSPSLISALEPVLLGADAHVTIERSAESVSNAIVNPPGPSLLMLDVELPGMDLGRVLEAARVAAWRKTFPIVLISDTVRHEWADLLADGVLDDIIPKPAESPHWRLRLEVLLRTFRRAREFELLHAAGTFDSETDPVTGILNRPALLSLLFRETDRVQRTNSSLCMILFGIDDLGDWNARLGTRAREHILAGVVGRVQHLLRSYDLFGRVAKEEFLLGLPGCRTEDAVAFARRMRHEAFSRPFHCNGREVRASGSFAIAASRGHSPIVVLRKAEQALRLAKAAGTGSIECADDCT